VPVACGGLQREKKRDDLYVLQMSGDDGLVLHYCPPSPANNAAWPYWLSVQHGLELLFFKSFGCRHVLGASVPLIEEDDVERALAFQVSSAHTSVDSDQPAQP